MRDGTVHGTGRRQLCSTLMRLGLTRMQAIRAVTDILGTINSHLAEQDHVSLQGFGSFHFRHNRRSLMWDPRLNRSRRVKGKVLLRFRPSQEFVDALRRNKS